VPYTQYTGRLSMDAEFVRCPTLKFKVEVAGAGGKPQCAGYCSANPAKKYYSGAHSPDVVQVSAAARPGYVFQRWSGDGVAWLSATLVGEEWEVSGNPVSLSDDQNPVASSPIYIKMADESNKPKSRELTAVFESCPCGPYGCDLACQQAEPLSAAEWNAFHTSFPGLRQCNVVKTGGADPSYNCFGFVRGSMNVISAHEFDQNPESGNGDDCVTVEEAITYFSLYGAFPYALYGDPDEPYTPPGASYSTEVRHAARTSELCPDCANSKMGINMIRMTHDLLEITVNPNPPPDYAAYGRLLFSN